MWCGRTFMRTNQANLQDLNTTLVIKSVLAKQGEHLPNWTENVFTVSKRVPRRPPVYKITDYDGEDLAGKDLYYTMKDNNVGGPSIIFNRYHEKDKTKMRNAEMITKHQEPKP